MYLSSIFIFSESTYLDDDWEYKLGNIPFSKLIIIQNSESNLPITKYVDSFIFTIYPLTRQKCQSFSYSETISLCMFNHIP